MGRPLWEKLGPLWRLGGGDASADKLLGIVLPTNLPLEEVHVVSSIPSRRILAIKDIAVKQLSYIPAKITTLSR